MHFAAFMAGAHAQVLGNELVTLECLVFIAQLKIAALRQAIISHTVAMCSPQLPLFSSGPVLREPFRNSFAAVGFSSTLLFVVEPLCVKVHSSIKLNAVRIHTHKSQ